MIEEVDVKREVAERFLKSLSTASICRYEAGARLKYRSIFSFQATIALSMGLIFIPLMQATSLKLAFPNEVLNMLQLFIAVAVLIFSVINSQSRYGIRAVYLNSCGDEIKKLEKVLTIRLSNADPSDLIKIHDIQAEYNSIQVDVENHSRTDYHYAVIKKVELRQLDVWGWIGLIWLRVKARCKYLGPYVIPTTVVLFECILILDMLSITKIFSPMFVTLAPVVSP